MIDKSQIEVGIPKIASADELRGYGNYEGVFSNLFFISDLNKNFKYDPTDTTSVDDGDTVIVNTITGKRFKHTVDPSIDDTIEVAISDRLPYLTIDSVKQLKDSQFTEIYITTNRKEGVFKYDSLDSTTVGDDALVVVDLDGKRYKRVLEGYVLPQWWGIIGDGTTNETEKWVKMISNPLSRKIRIPKPLSSYRITTLDLESDTDIDIEPGVVIKGMGTNSFREVLRIHGKKNVTIRGYGATIMDLKASYPSSSEFNGGISIRSSENVSLFGLDLRDFGGDGVYIGTSTYGVTNKNIRLKDLSITNANRNGISVINVDGLWIDDVRIDNINGTAPESGIDIEPNNNSEVLKAIYVNNLYTSKCNSAGILISPGGLKDGGNPVDITINNHIDKESRHGFINYYSLTGINGSLSLNNPKYTGNASSAIVIYGHDAANYRIDVNSATITDCHRVNTANYRNMAGAVIMYRHVGDNIDSREMGNVHFRDISIIDTKINDTDRIPVKCFIFRDGSEQVSTWTNCSIIDPLRLDYKGTSNLKIAAYNLRDIHISDRYNTLLYNFSSAAESVNIFQNNNTPGAIVSKFTNRGATGDNTISLNQVASINYQLEIEVTDPQKIIVGSAFYRIRPLGIGNHTIWSNQIGAKLKLRKDTATNYYFAEEVIGLWYSGDNNKVVNQNDDIYMFPTRTSDFFINQFESIVPVDATSKDDMIITLPNPSGRVGSEITVKKIDNTSNRVRVSAQFGYSIDGYDLYHLYSKGDSITVRSDNSSMWKIVAEKTNGAYAMRTDITTNQTKSSLNLNYGHTRKGFVVYCPSIISGGQKYTKLSDGNTGDWGREMFMLTT